jgi:ABC-type amino acid transport substrate-binding protein
LFVAAVTPAHAQNLEATLRTIQQTRTIRLGYLQTAVPFSFADDKKQPAGFSVDLCQRVANGIQQQLGLPSLEIKWVPVTQENRFDMVRDGAIDLECGTSTHTLSREKTLDFSLTIWVDGANFVVNPAVSGARRLADLNGKKIAVIAGTTTERALAEVAERDFLSFELVEVKDHLAGLNALNDKKVDAYATDQAVLIGLAFAVRDQMRVLMGEQPFSYEPYALVMRRGDPDFRLAVNTVIARVLRSAQILQIYDRWFGKLGKPTALLVATWATNGLPE